MQKYCLGLILLLSGCNGDFPHSVPGYIEGVYIDYSAPVAGRLSYRPQYDGENVVSGDLLFVLSEHPEKEKLEGIEAKIEQSSWQLKDLEKGLRVDDIAYLQANVDGAYADVEYWTQNLERLEQLGEDNLSLNELDVAKQNVQKSKSALDAARAKLKSGQLGERSDLVLAKRAEIKALKAKEKELSWYLTQKKKQADFTGKVKEIYYETGEWISAYKTIMTVEDSDRRYVVFYLNQVEIANIVMGDDVLIVSANNAVAKARVVFIADQAEYTPPIVYTVSQGELYRFKVKAELQTSQYLHPGQPVSVQL